MTKPLTNLTLEDLNALHSGNDSGTSYDEWGWNDPEVDHVDGWKTLYELTLVSPISGVKHVFKYYWDNNNYEVFSYEGFRVEPADPDPVDKNADWMSHFANELNLHLAETCKTPEERRQRCEQIIESLRYSVGGGDDA